MTTHEILVRQYHAALTMLGNAIRDCPTELWNASGYKNRFWHIAFHTLFYTHLYLAESEAAFTVWPQHRQGYQHLTPKGPGPLVPYTPAEVLEYLELCHQEVDTQLPLTQLDAPSGFEWIPFDKLELQLYNLRHIAHHAGQLIDRLRESADLTSAWVGQ